ncbi:MAG: hypothetical protein ACOCT9_00945, partial [archaeon]
PQHMNKFAGFLEETEENVTDINENKDVKKKASENPSLSGWTEDTYDCILKLEKEEFTLQDVYKFEEKLKELHPNNNFIKAKIRQQLQVLRDKGILEFIDDSGNYRIVR